MPPDYRVGLYIHASDPQLAANQRAALRLYAENMGWTVVIEMGGEIEPLIHAAAEHAIQLVLCWRLSDMPEAESLLIRLHTTGVDLLPLAQSCAALQEEGGSIREDQTLDIAGKNHVGQPVAHTPG